MTQPHSLIRAALLIGTVLASATLTFAAEVTPARLLNPNAEPQNWLMNHRTYDGQRFSPLARINRANAKNLRLAFAVPIGGLGPNEWVEATPLAENGFLYITNSWGVLYKIDATSGEYGRIVWEMDPKQEKQGTNRGAAFWGNLVISPANWPARLIATDKDSGKVVWETNMMFDQAETRLTAAPLALKDKIIVGASGGDSGVRDWIAGVDAATGRVLWRKFTIPAPGEPGSETWKGNTNAWQTGGGAVWVTGTYDPQSNQTIWGTGNPVPMFDPFYRPGDNLYTNSAISWDPESGKMNWYFQYTPGDMWDYDEVGTHILIDGVVAGQPRKLITHSARNGFLYTMDRANGAMVVAKPYLDNVNWTKGIDQKTGKPIDYDPNKEIQTYGGGRQSGARRAAEEGVPVAGRRQQLLAVVLQPADQAHLHPGDHRLRQRLDRPRQAQRPARLERRLEPDRGALGEQSHRHGPDHRRGEEVRPPALPELFRHAGHRRRRRLPRAFGRHSGSL